MVAKKRASFERKLGADLGPLLAAVADRVALDGKRFGASTKKEAAASVTAKYLLGAVRAEVEARGDAIADELDELGGAIAPAATWAIEELLGGVVATDKRVLYFEKGDVLGAVR